MGMNVPKLAEMGESSQGLVLYLGEDRGKEF